MSRKLIVLFVALALVALFFVSRTPSVEAQSAGCSAVSGALSGFLAEGPAGSPDSSKSLGPSAFNAGETIQISAVIDGTSSPYSFFTLAVNGSSVGSGPVASYQIPSAGNYTISVQNDTGVDASLTASCGGGGGVITQSREWSGTADGRLSPDPAEYYSIWCTASEVSVYTTNGGSNGQLLVSVPKATLESLSSVPSSTKVRTSFGTDLTVWRLGNTVFRFEGGNGNSSQPTGSKDVDVAGCGMSLTPPGTTQVVGSVVAQPEQQVFEIVVVIEPTAIPDRDGDGVADADDLCPTESVVNLREDRKEYGCRDSDGDGYVNAIGVRGNYVLDDNNPLASFEDNCPLVAGVAPLGCPPPGPETVTVPPVTLTGVPLPGATTTSAQTILGVSWNRISTTGSFTTPCTQLAAQNLGGFMGFTAALCSKNPSAP